LASTAVSRNSAGRSLPDTSGYSQAPPDPFVVAADLLDADASAWQPLPHQVPPDFDSGDWLYFVLAGGRGTGKTDAGAYAFDRYMRAHPGHRGRIIAPTLGDAREACVVGPSGIKAHNPDVRWNSNEGVLYWPNGSRAKIFGAYTPEDVERLRAGGNAHLDWYEELAAWKQIDGAWNQARFGLRLGVRPRTIVTTTPKARKRWRWLVGRPQEGLPDCPPIVLRHGTTADNPHLSEQVRQELYATYEGTRLGAQELYGQELEDVEGALWKQAGIDEGRATSAEFRRRIDDGELRLLRVVVAVDPPGGRTEAGIVAAALGSDRRGYVLGDHSTKGGPDVWVAALLGAYRLHEADCIVAETNYGGDMVAHSISGAGERNVPVKVVTATRGKRVRAEPVSMLYEKRRISHVGLLPKLEGEQTTWVPDAGMESPNRMDALVWALTDLMLGPAQGSAFLEAWGQMAKPATAA
jgi:phage terminase large subunit-like protein